MNDVFTSLAEQALGRPKVIQPLVASRFGLAPTVLADISSPIAEASGSTASRLFTAPLVAQVSKLPEPLISPETARTAAPHSTFRQMAQATSAIQTAPQSDAIESNAVDSASQRLNLPRAVEPEVDKLPERKIDRSSQVAQLTHMSVTSLSATIPLPQELAQGANMVTPVTSPEAPERSVTLALGDSQSHATTTRAGSTTIGKAAPINTAGLLPVTTTAPMDRPAQTSDQRIEPAFDADPGLTDHEPTAALLRVQKPSSPTSVDSSAIVPALFDAQSEAPMLSDFIRTAAPGSSSSEEPGNTVSHNSPNPPMQVPSFGVAAEKHSPNLASIVNEAEAETKHATPAARARSRAALTAQALSVDASNVIEQHMPSPQTTNLAESPQSSTIHQPQDRNPEQAIAPLIMHEPTIEDSHQPTSQDDPKTPVFSSIVQIDELPKSAFQLTAYLMSERSDDDQLLSHIETTRPMTSASIDKSSSTLSLGNVSYSSAVADGMGAPHPFERNSAMSDGAEGSIRPRLDLQLVSMNALHETASRNQPHAEVEAPPTIRVTIGRIEVHTTPAPQPTAPLTRPAQTVLSLQEYLKQRRSKKS